MRSSSIGALTAALLMSACGGGSPSASDTKIGNGVDVTEDNDATRAVVMVAGRSGRGHCTGTLLNDTTMITAVHCLLNYDNGGVYLNTPDGDLIASKRVFYAPRARTILARTSEIGARMSRYASDLYATDPTCDTSGAPSEIRSLQTESSRLMRELPALDIALVVFPAGTGDAITGGSGYYGIVERAPRAGDSMLFVGFGHTSANRRQAEESCGTTLNGEGFGKKRQGTNRVGQVGDGMVMAVGYASRTHAESAGVAAGEQASIRPGDSGGPWIACADSSCTENRLFGINSTGSFRELAREIATGADATSQASKKLFQAAINCGEGLCAANFVGSGVARTQGDGPR